MRIGVISDTHGHVGYTLRATQVFERFAVETIIHCGDIGSTEIVPLFNPWPTHFVLGNIDWNAEELRQAIAQSGQTCHERFGRIELENVRISFLHSDDEKRFKQATSNGSCDLVCYGHTHIARVHAERNIILVNPGAVWRSNPPSVAVIDLPSIQVTPVTLLDS